MEGNDSDRRLRLSEVSPGTRIYGLLAQGDVLEWDTMIPLKWCPDGPGTTCLSWAVSQNGATPFGFNERIVKWESWGGLPCLSKTSIYSYKSQQTSALVTERVMQWCESS